MKDLEKTNAYASVRIQSLVLFVTLLPGLCSAFTIRFNVLISAVFAIVVSQQAEEVQSRQQEGD